MLEKEKEELRAAAASKGAAVIEVKGQLDVANKSLEAQRASNRELEVLCLLVYFGVRGGGGEKNEMVKVLWPANSGQKLISQPRLSVSVCSAGDHNQQN